MEIAFGNSQSLPNSWQLVNTTLNVVFGLYYLLYLSSCFITTLFVKESVHALDFNFLYIFKDFYLFHSSWFTVFHQFSTVQQSDLVTHTYKHSFSHIILHHAPS